MNRPERLNALNDELIGLVVDALEEADRDEDVRCIVLAGGEKAFAAGADIGQMATASAMDMYALRDRIDAWDRIKNVRTPIVAAVSGYCLGGGNELAMACDLIVAVADRAVRPAGDRRRDHPRRGRHAAADARGRQVARDGRHPRRPVPDGRRGASRRARRARRRRLARRGEVGRERDRGEGADRDEDREGARRPRGRDAARGRRRRRAQGAVPRLRLGGCERGAERVHGEAPSRSSRGADGRGRDHPRRRGADDHAEPPRGVQRVQRRAARAVGRRARRSSRPARFAPS